MSYLNLDALALVVHGDALAAGLLVAVVGEAHGGAVGRGEGAEGLLAGAEVHVGEILGVVEGDAGVVDGVDGGGERCEGGGEEEGEGRHGRWWLVGWFGSCCFVWLVWVGCGSYYGWLWCVGCACGR